MKKVRAQDFARDFRSGMGDLELMAKYDLKPSEFRIILRKLTEKGFLTREELEKHSDLQSSAEGVVFSCPSCGAMVPARTDECFKCGIVISKFDETATLQVPTAYRAKTPQEEALARAIEEVKRLDVKELEIREKAGIEGMPSVFIGIAIVAAGVVVGCLEVSGVVGAVVPVALGTYIYFRGCYVVAARKGYTGREGVFLGILFGIGTLILLLMPNRHTGVWGLREAIVFGLYVPAVIVLVAIGVARVTGYFIL